MRNTRQVPRDNKEVRVPHCNNLWRPLGISRRPTNGPYKIKKEYEKSYAKPMRSCTKTNNSEIGVS